LIYLSFKNILKLKTTLLASTSFVSGLLRARTAGGDGYHCFGGSCRGDRGRSTCRWRIPETKAIHAL